MTKNHDANAACRRELAQHLVNEHKLGHALHQAVLACAGKAGQQGLQLGAAAHAPDEFGMTAIDGFFFHMLYDRRGHNFHKHGALPKHFAITAKICCTSVWVRYIVSSSMITSAGAFFSAISPRQSSIADWAI